MDFDNLIRSILINLLLSRSYWNRDTIKHNTRKLWMDNKDLLPEDDKIVLRCIIVELRRIMVNHYKSYIPSRILVYLFNTQVAICLQEPYRTEMINHFIALDDPLNGYDGELA